MQTIKRNLLSLTTVLVLVAALFGAGLSPVRSVAAACNPTATFDLYAKTGTATLYTGLSSVTIWGYSLTSGGAATLPGPVLTVTQGACVGVTLHNGLTENTALLFQGQSLTPDTTGAAPGGTAQYSFTAATPGTFLYEAGLIPGKQHQVAMGLYGALIVLPPGLSAYNVEKTLVLSEFDAALAANPIGYDMRKYAPRYFLVNGKAYPDTDLLANQIAVSAGNTVLLRYVNGGLQAHAMSTLGLSQKAIAVDGKTLAHAHNMVSETIAPGQTLDAVAIIPASAAAGTKYALYDGNLLLRNTNANGLGGMLTFLTVGAGSGSGSDTTGPLLSSLTLSPNPSTGTVAVTLAFTANDTTTGNSNVTAAEYWIDGGAHTAITVGAPAVSVNLTALIPAGLAHGTHVVSVRAQDALGNWSTTSTINLVVDSQAPTTSELSLTPNPSNGSVGVTFSFTGNDTASGNSNITAAEYWIDAGAHVPVSVSSPAPVKILTVVLAGPFSVGTNTVSARTQDALGNWSLPATISLVVDQTGPATSAAVAVYNPNNGTKPFNTSVQAVRVSANFNDAAFGNSNIATAEAFLDVAGVTGTGFVFVATDGLFNSPTENGYADIPLAVVNTLSTGSHPICIHAKDAAGNWGATDCSYNLIIDRAAPTVVSINRVGANPSPNGSVQFLVTFSEGVNGVAASNFTILRTGLGGTSSITSITGGPSAWTVTATTGTGAGTIGLNLTSPTGISDLAGNAMTSAGLPFVGQIFNIVPPPQPSLYFSTSGNTNPPSVAGTADDADIYFYNTATSAFTRSIDVTTITNPLPTGANVDGFDRISATQFYMSFSGDVTVPGIAGTVADEDIVLRNGTTWTLYFDGSANGIGATDIDAFSIVGAGGPGNIYFSTDNTTVPPGAGGSGDDADIYRWNGGSSYTRVVDASVLGWSTANVDGLVWVDATHVYLSYSADTTVPGIGTVQDEDIVYYNTGVWTVYFDGTAVGLTNANHDIDAFDLP